MKNFIQKAYKMLKHHKKTITLVLPLLIGLIAFIFCQKLPCAIGYYITSAIVTMIVYILLEATEKAILTVRQKRADKINNTLRKGGEN